MGIYNATSALLQQMPGETQGRGGKTVADVTNNDFEHFPTREDVCPRYLVKIIFIIVIIHCFKIYPYNNYNSLTIKDF